MVGALCIALASGVVIVGFPYDGETRMLAMRQRVQFKQFLFMGRRRARRLDGCLCLLLGLGLVLTAMDARRARDADARLERAARELLAVLGGLGYSSGNNSTVPA